MIGETTPATIRGAEAQTERDIVEELKGSMREAAGDRLQAVIVFGSRAWGQAGPDSGLDVAE